MKKLLLIVVYIVFARAIFAQTPQPLSDNYIGCLGYTVVAGFETDPAISYVWYSVQTGGAPIYNNLYTVPFTIDAANFPTVGSSKTYWAEPHLGSPTGPFVPGYDANNRIPITVTRGDNCGTINPSGCYSSGRLLFKEDFGGNNPYPTDPRIGPALPAGITTYNHVTCISNVTPGCVGCNRCYYISKIIYKWYDWWYTTIDDHTYPNDTTRGYMFVTDASLEPDTVYECTIRDLCPGTRVSFSAWVVSLNIALTQPAKVNLVFVVEDAFTHKVLAQFYTGNIPDGDPNWRNYGFAFVPTSPNIILRILNNSTQNNKDGNDFALDDIEIRLCIPPINMPNTEFSTCSGENFSLHPNFNNDGLFAEPLEYQWYFSTDGTSGWTPIPGQNNLDLNITNVSINDIGYYFLAITGAGGDINNTTCRSTSDPVYLRMGKNTSFGYDVCGFEQYYFKGELLTESGVYKDTIPMANGCDSIVTLTFTISGGIGERYDTICYGETYSFHGQYLTETNTYSSTIFQNANGCDTIDRLHLQVNPLLRRTIDAEICKDKTYDFYGTPYNQSVYGIQHRFSNPSGCDSIVTLNLTVNPYNTKIVHPILCYGDTYTYYDNVIIATTSGNIYKDTVPSTTGGCDTIVTIITIVNPLLRRTEVAEICKQDLPYYFYGTPYDQSVYGIQYRFSNPGRCDSIVTLNLTVKPYNTKPIIPLTLCEGDTYDFYGREIVATMSANGYIYKDTVPSTIAGACDTIVQLILTVNKSYAYDDFYTMCSGESYTWHGKTYTTSGDFPDRHTTIKGCDSIYTLHLTVIDNVNVDVGIQNPVCADDDRFILIITPKTPDAVLPTNYSIDFSFKETENGGLIPFHKDDNVTGNEIEVEMPPKIYPNKYPLTITLSDNTLTVCGGVEINTDFNVLYPDTIMQQKWNNVIALLNEYYNGGFRFVGYQWYHNDDLMPNATNSYIYIGAGSSFVVDEDKYSVLIEREDGSKIFSCQLTAQSPKPTESQYPTLVNPNSSIHIEINGKTAIAHIWSVTGILVANAKINYSGEEIIAPSQQGVYLLEIISDNNSREIVPIVVK